MKRIVPPTLVLALTLLAAPAAAVPEQLGLTARVLDAGTPISGMHVVTVRLHGTDVGGIPVWSETHDVEVVDGLVYVTLGRDVPLTADLIDGGALFVEVQVDSTVLSPRLEVTSAAYAIRAGLAEDAELLGGLAPSAFAPVVHDHDGVYLPLGPTLSCGGSDHVTGLDLSTGSVICAPSTSTVYAAGSGISIAGSTISALYSGSGTSAFLARSDHNHAGIYLPVGTTLGCPAGQSVIGLSPSGSVMCAATGDITDVVAGLGLTGGAASGFATLAVAYGGTGISTSAARSDHNHAGVYLPVGSTLGCAAGEAVVGLNASGNVLCAATGDITGVVAGSGLVGGALSGSASLAVAFAGTGVASTASRSDHLHTARCPTGFTAHTASGAVAPLCIARVTIDATWNTAATDCFVNHAGGHLCTANELRVALTTSPIELLTVGYWLGDRLADDVVLQVNSTNIDNFDGSVDIVSTVVTGPGYYCCATGN
jgi:hypothetical protein